MSKYYMPNTVHIGLTLNTNQCGASYSWNFGDGTSVAIGNPVSHIFPPGVGSYNVVLTINGSITINHQINIGVNPPAIYGPLCIFDLNQLYNYSVNSQPGLIYDWTIVGGTPLTFQNSSNIDVTWLTQSGGSVTVTVTDPATGCSAFNLLNVPQGNCMSISKSVTPSQGNQATLFDFTIIACAGASPVTANLADNLPSGAYNITSNLPIGNVTIAAGTCNTYNITCSFQYIGSFCNEVTITDVNSTIHHTDDACFDVICDPLPGFTDYSNYVSAPGTTILNGNMFISGTFTISPGSTVTFDACDILLAPNAKITVDHDAVLNITTTGTTSFLHSACDYMWDGIYVLGGTGTQNDGILNINNGTRINDAIYAVYSDNDGGDFHIDNSFFDLNYVSIHALNRGNFQNSNISGNQFDASGPLKLTLAPTPLVSNTFAYIDAQNINQIITIDNNTFNPGAEYDIYANKVGRLESLQNRFDKPNKSGIFGDFVKAMVVNNFNNFNECPIGIECYHTQLEVDNQNTFSNGIHGIVVSQKSSCQVTNQNLFVNNKIGIFSNYYTYTYIDNNLFEKNFIDIHCWATYGTIIISNNVMNDPELVSIFTLDNIFNTTTVQHIHHNQISNTNPTANNPNTNIASGIISSNNSNTNRDYNIIESNLFNDIGYAIQVTKSDYSMIADNEITLPENDANGPLKYKGINVEVSNNSLVGKNLVHGHFVPEFITSGTGIHVNNSSRVWEICNVVDNLFNGLLWESNSFGAILVANSMIECAQDLYLNNVFAGLGQQYLLFGGTYMPFDNQWINNVTVNWHIANEFSNVGSPIETEFIVRTTPAQYLPTSQTLILGGNTSQISTPTNITPNPIDCSLFQYSIPKDESREALLIARDSLDFQPGEEGLRWMSQEYLFNLLKTQPQLLLDYPELNAALITLESSTISDFNKLSDTLVIATDSTVQSVLADSLNVLNLDSLALAKAAEVKAINDAIAVQHQIEENKRIMNDVYLNTSAIGITVYTPAQLEAIRGITAQCPAYGGPSVYEARVLLLLLDSVRVDYSSSCIGLLRNAAAGTNTPVNFIGRIYPNPSTGLINYEYRMEKNSSGTITINNIWGQELKRIPLTEGLNHLTIDCRNFADGIYLYNIVVNNTTIARDKLTIIKE